LIGPRYDAEENANHHMSGGSLSDWFDLIVYRREATPTRPLGEARDRHQRRTSTA
jgi:erythromycin esterase